MGIIWFIIGVCMGLVAMVLSKCLIHNRAGTDVALKLYGNKAIFCWMAFSGIVSVAIGVFSNATVMQAIESILVFTVCLSLSAVDFEIKKIPNVLLLALLVLKICMLIITKDSVTTAITGLFFAFFVFLFPARFGKSIGMGDVKLAMVIGFYVGIWGLLQAVAIMGICLLFYWAYLYITHKGNLQTSIALGPYLSIGFVIAQCVRLPLHLWPV